MSQDPSYLAYQNRRLLYSTTLARAIRFSPLIISLLPVLALIAVYTLVICILVLHFNYTSLIMNNLPIQLFSTVIATLMGFRTNRAFDRYWLAAQTWTTLSTQIRNVSRLIWNGISESTHERKKGLKLALAIAYANKHSLRGLNANIQPDVMDLVKESFPTHENLIIKKLSRVHSNADNDHGDISMHAVRGEQTIIPKRTIVVSAPLEIAYKLGAFIRSCRKQGKVDQDDIPALNTCMNNILDAITKFELMFVV